MKSIFRLSFLVLFALAASSVARANWFNHPIVTSSHVITGWFTPYSDVAGPHYLPGPTLPAINLGKIKDNWDNTDATTHGGSYPIFNNSSESHITGYVNFPVTKSGTTYTVGTPTFTSSPTFKVYG